MTRDLSRVLQEMSATQVAQARAIKRSQELEQERQAKAQIDATVDLFARVYDKALLYTNVVLAGGYVALFTTWGLTAPHMDVRLWLLAGLLAAISVAFFVGWEVYKGIITAWQTREFAKAAAADQAAAPRLFGEFQKKLSRTEVSSFRVWSIVITISLLTGFGAMLIILGSLVARLFVALSEVLGRGLAT